MALRDVWLLLSIIIFSHGLPLVLCQSVGIADVSVSALGYVEIQINKPGFDSVSLIKPKHQYISPVDRLRQIQNRAVTGEVGGAFDFFPDFKGAANSIAPITFTGHCFQNVTVMLDISAEQVTIDFQLLQPETRGCSSLYLIADQEQFYVKWYFQQGHHQLVFQSLGDDELKDIHTNGMQIFEIHGSILKEVFDVFDTLMLFKGPWTEQESLRFLQTHMNLTYTKRSEAAMDIPEELIPDGTYIATQRFDGSEVMIQYGTGSYSGHSVIAFRVNGTLHVCESNGKNSPDYWPPPYGVTCHPYAEWLKLAHAAHYSLTLMPLHPDLQERFNNERANQFLQSVLGLPYGSHNFLFGFIDTIEDNFPPPLSPQFFEVAFAILDRIYPALAQNLYIDALNMRLGTQCTNITCIIMEVIRLNITLMDVMIRPEQDDWVYPDGKSMVCDVFVLEVYKAAGVFGSPPLNFQATEFTPKDLYTMQIFDPSYKQKLISLGYACPEYPTHVCQIAGDYVAQFPDWNTIQPYAGMCERCPSKWPDYIRPPGC